MVGIRNIQVLAVDIGAWRRYSLLIKKRLKMDYTNTMILLSILEYFVISIMAIGALVFLFSDGNEKW